MCHTSGENLDTTKFNEGLFMILFAFNVFVRTIIATKTPGIIWLSEILLLGFTQKRIKSTTPTSAGTSLSYHIVSFCQSWWHSSFATLRVVVAVAVAVVVVAVGGGVEMVAAEVPVAP